MSQSDATAHPPPALPARTRAREPRRGLGALAGIAIALIASTGTAVMLLRRATPLPPVIGAVPEFRFAEAHGGEVSLQSLRGHVWVGDFVFTSCASACPRMSAEMARLQKETSDVPAVRMVSFALDPERDTPGALQEHAARYGADRARWSFLLGEDDAMQRLARETFFLATAPGDPAQGQDRIIHSDRFVLVDAEGRLRGTYSSSDEEAMRRLRRDLRQLADG